MSIAVDSTLIAVSLTISIRRETFGAIANTLNTVSFILHLNDISVIFQ